MTTPTLSQARAAFAHETGPLAEQALIKAPPSPPARGRSPRLVLHETDAALAVVVGAHEEGAADDALALSLALRGDRRLVLMLPDGWAAPTVARWAWLRPDLPLEVWTHEGGVAERLPHPERRALPARTSAPTVPLPPKAAAWVEDLVRWAGDRRELDPAHHGTTRAWDCHGQPVLTVARESTNALAVTAGQVTQDVRGPLGSTQLRALQAGVREQVQARVTGSPDLAWLRAALRRHPRALGLEEPVLRQVATRRRSTGFSRPSATAGSVDALGLDPTGRVVAAVATLGGDDAFVLRALDDYAFLSSCLAPGDDLGARLGLHERAELELALCVAAPPGTEPTISKHSRAQLAALAPDIRWHVQSVRGWTEGTPLTRRYPTGVLPDALG